jgi:hypothetical protein
VASSTHFTRCAHLQSKNQFPDIRVEVTCTLFSNTLARQAEFEKFSSHKVDRLLLNARNILSPA